MIIDIDTNSGFCFGVNNAIKKAEELLVDGEKLNCLGDIVHNHEEILRLERLGIKTISPDEINSQKNTKVLIRTHGEPPSTYSILKANNNKIIDATCPVVLKLQSRIKKSYSKLSQENGQLVIFGKKGHAEVIGLNGQTNFQSIIVSTIDDLSQLDFSRPVELYCQTTMPLDAFHEIAEEIKKRATSNNVIIHDTICRQVANRVPHLKIFSSKYDVVLFVSGKKSSNGKQLYEICKKANSNTFFISTPNEINPTWFINHKSIGICGATSTPQWQLLEIKYHVKAILNID